LYDFKGLKIGKLQVIDRANKSGYWLCKCDCGKEIIVATYNLKRKTVKSCGCYRKERCKDISKKHNMSNSRLYMIYNHMKSRCNNPNDKRFNCYGGRGIKICEEWENDFMNFYNWAINNGYNDNLTIDRIDNDKGYSPSNCRWLTRSENNKNRRICKNGIK
jgi:hypothetical protein